MMPTSASESDGAGRDFSVSALTQALQSDANSGFGLSIGEAGPQVGESDILGWLWARAKTEFAGPELGAG